MAIAAAVRPPTPTTPEKVLYVSDKPKELEKQY